LGYGLHTYSPRRKYIAAKRRDVGGTPLQEGGKSLQTRNSGTDLPPSLREVAAKPPEGVWGRSPQ
jgi:hypothetical protein